MYSPSRGLLLFPDDGGGGFPIIESEREGTIRIRILLLVSMRKSQSSDDEKEGIQASVDERGGIDEWGLADGTSIRNGWKVLMYVSHGAAMAGPKATS